MTSEKRSITLVEALSELKYAREHSAEYSGRMQELIESVLRSVKNFKNWFLLRSTIAPIPYAFDNKAFLFTNSEMAHAALEDFRTEKGIGEHLLEIYEYPLYGENIFTLLKRHGIEKVCINKGKNALTISMEKIGVTADSNPFTAVVDKFVLDTYDDEKYQEAENAFTQKLSSCQLYYVSPEAGEHPLVEPYYIDGLEQNAIFLFTDKAELRQQYPLLAGNIVYERAIQIFKKNQGSLFVINPSSSNILVGENSIDACIEIWDTFSTVFITVKHHTGNKETAIKYAKAIVKNQRVCSEYLRCVAADDPDYPADNALRTMAGYTAEMINDISDSMSIEMTYAIMASVFDEPRDAIKDAIRIEKTKLQA